MWNEADVFVHDMSYAVLALLVPTVPPRVSLNGFTGSYEDSPSVGPPETSQSAVWSTQSSTVNAPARAEALGNIAATTAARITRPRIVSAAHTMLNTPWPMPLASLYTGVVRFRSSYIPGICRPLRGLAVFGDASPGAKGPRLLTLALPGRIARL